MADYPPSDPTALTTAQLQREIAQSREILQVRLDAMDKAVEVLNDYPTRVDEKINALRDIIESKLDALTATCTEKFGSMQVQLRERDDKFQTLRELFEEKFAGVMRQFTERDTRSIQQETAAGAALAAALSAAKEAVGKNEMATDRRIGQLEQLINEKSKTSDEKIGDVKDRLTRIEGRGEGTSVTSAIQQSQGNAAQQRALTVGGFILVVVMAFVGYHVQSNSVRTAKHDEQLADVLRSRDERTGIISGLVGKMEGLNQRVNILEQKVK